MKASLPRAQTAELTLPGPLCSVSGQLGSKYVVCFSSETRGEEFPFCFIIIFSPGVFAPGLPRASSCYKRHTSVQVGTPFLPPSWLGSLVRLICHLLGGCHFFIWLVKRDRPACSWRVALPQRPPALAETRPISELNCAAASQTKQHWRVRGGGSSWSVGLDAFSSR